MNTGPMSRQLEHDRENLLALMQDTLRRQPIPCVNGGLACRFWTSDERADLKRAAVECGACPVLSQCRAYGLAHPKEQGIYGGLTKPERVRMAREAQQDTATASGEGS